MDKLLNSKIVVGSVSLLIILLILFVSYKKYHVEYFSDDYTVEYMGYVISQGDTLTSIIEKQYSVGPLKYTTEVYQTDVIINQICKVNKIDKDNIKFGNLIVLPYIVE